MRRIWLADLIFLTAVIASTAGRDWAAAVLTPFWQSRIMVDEPVLFIRNADAGEARGEVFFPPQKVVQVRDSALKVTYEEGRDFLWKAETREIVLPAGSRIPSSLPGDLRRPANSQKYSLPHRDGKSDILFGPKLEYASLQTYITYEHRSGLWSPPAVSNGSSRLPRTLEKLRAGKPVRIVLLGDSISGGCNASGWASEEPFQPAYPELFRSALERRFHATVDLKNLSVGGKDSAWGITRTDDVVSLKPDLVIVAFGGNDASRRLPADFKVNVQSIWQRVRNTLPGAEFILVATMPGNPEWTQLHYEYFSGYRNALAELAELSAEGVALADVTSIWTALLKHKKYADLTGNGVNHPNDFGHRIYAQVLASLLPQ